VCVEIHTHTRSKPAIHVAVSLLSICLCVCLYTHAQTHTETRTHTCMCVNLHTYTQMEVGDTAACIASLQSQLQHLQQQLHLLQVSPPHTLHPRHESTLDHTHTCVCVCVNICICECMHTRKCSISKCMHPNTPYVHTHPHIVCTWVLHGFCVDARTV
jgi:hypothetical protein